MKAHTNNFKNEIKLLGREIDSKITYTLNGDEIVLDGENINSISPHYEGAILKSVMKQLDLDIDTDIPLNTILNAQFGVKVNGAYEYLNLGNYIVYKTEKQEDLGSYKITCYDKMLYSMKAYETPKLNNVAITYPITIKNYIKAICETIGLDFANENDDFTNHNKLIPRELYLDEEGGSLNYTFRDVLDELAEVTASTICINDDDELEIRYVNNVGEYLEVEGTNLQINSRDTNDFDIQLEGDTYQKSSQLPISYTQVDYIEATGTQYIDTGIKMNNSIKLDITAQLGELGNNFPLVAANMKSNANSFGIYLRLNASYGRCTAGTNWNNYVDSAWNDQIMNIIYDNDKFILDGTTLNITQQEYETERNLEIFRSYNENRYGKYKLFSMKMYNNGTLIRDFIPCYRNADSVIGLYDLVNGVFYTNQGTGTFGRGVVTELPSEYTRVESVQNVSGAYIDTGYVPDSTNGFKFEISYTPTVADKRYCVLSNYNTTGHTSLEVFSSNKSRIYINNGQVDNQANATLSTTNINKVVVEYNDGTLRHITNGVEADISQTLSLGSSSLYMFLDRQKRTSTFTEPIKIYDCKLYNGGTLVRYFVPCYRNSDNEVGFYDLVNNTFYANAGTNSFSYDKPIPNPDYPQPVQVVTGDNTIKVVGKNLLDTNTFTLKRDTNRTISFNFPTPLSAGTYTISWKVTNMVDLTSSSICMGWAIYKSGVPSSTNLRTLPSLYSGETGTSYTFTLTDTANYIYAYITNGASNTATITLEDLQIEKSNQATDYTPYQSQEYTIDLGDLELCKIETYQDYLYKSEGNWYKHKEIGKITLDGTIGGYNSGSNWFYIGLSNLGISTTTNIGICDYFRFYDNFTSLANTTIGMGLSNNLTNFLIRNTSLVSENDYKTWLSNNKPIVYYVLATPTYTKITNTELINQLESIRLLEGVNNISVGSDNLSSPIKLTYLASRDTIDEEFLKDVNVNFGKMYGPINTIILSRNEVDNISQSAPSNLEDSKKKAIKIVDNQIMNFDDRDEYLTEILKRLNGLSYYINDFASTGIVYYNICDKYDVSINGKLYDCIMFNDEVNITQGLVENIYTEMPEETEEEYKYMTSTDKGINKAYLKLNKQEQTFELMLSQSNTDLEGRLDEKYNQIYVTNEAFTIEQGERQAIDDQINGNGGLKDQIDDNEQRLNNVSKFFKYENGILTLGESNSNFKLELEGGTNGEIRFMGNGIKLGYFNSERLYVENTTVFNNQVIAKKGDEDATNYYWHVTDDGCLDLDYGGTEE